MSLFKKDPINVQIHGRDLKCLVCGNDDFIKREAQLNSSGMSFLNMEWAGPSGVCYVCAKCGYIHWFLPQ